MTLTISKIHKAKKKIFVLYFAAVLMLAALVPTVHSDPSDPWWNTSWTYRKELTIDNTKVSTTLSNFPVLIKITDSDIKLKAQSDGDDIVFTDKNAIQLHHEIEKYNSTTGELIAWVNIPLLSATQDTTFYIYYGNPLSGTQQNSMATWDVHFKAVHHLEETSGSIIDSTSNENNGVAYGTPNQNVDGKIDGADYFDGIDDHFTLPRIYTNENQFTFEAWIYVQTGARYFISQRSSTSQGVFLQMADDNYLQYYINAEKDGRSITPNTWNHVVLTYDGSTANLYVNGAVRSKACSLPIWPSEGMYLGDRSTGGRQFHGYIDEARFSNIARTEGWITTCYNNQNNPTSFFSVGLEEVTTGEDHPPVISNEQPMNGANNVPVSLSELSFIVSDADDDSIAYTVIASPDIIGGVHTGSGISSGTTITIPITTTPLSEGTSYSWQVSVTDGVFWTNTTFGFSTAQQTTNSWPYRKQITIDHTKVSSSLTQFPLLLKITDTDLAAKAQETGNDIYFTDAADMKLSHEIEKYTSATGELVCWINIPSLSANTDTILFMYYGNPDAENQQNIQQTWDSHFLAVHHLEEPSGVILDSTSYDNDGIPSGSLNQDVDGRIDGADAFDGVDDHITLPRVYTDETEFTMEAWIYAQNGARYFISQRSGSAQGVFIQLTNNFLQYYINGVSDGRTISFNTWYHVVLTYSGSIAYLYVNGIARIKTCPPPIWPPEGMYLGDRSTGGRQFNGILDEVRFSNTARTSGWITTSFSNQNNPASFYNVGLEEIISQDLSPVISNEQPLNGAVNVPITLSHLSFLLTDPDDDLMACTITTTPDIIGGVQYGDDINSGTTITIPITTTPLAYGTSYLWHVSATDGFYWKNKTFSFTTLLSNTVPLQTNPYPGNNSGGIGVNPVLAISVSDAENDNMNIIFKTNASTGTWHQIGSTQTGSSGRYSQPTSEMNQYNKKYWWSVHVIDPLGSGQWTNKTYTFRTVQNITTPPTISNPYPTGNQIVPYNPRLRITVNDAENDTLTVIFKTNASGTWQIIGSETNGNKIYTQNTTNMEIKNKKYFWSIHVHDGTFWVNNTYSFIVQPFLLKWSYNANVATSIAPLAVDVNNDGIYEIFGTGVGKAFCVNGLTGALIWQYYNNEIIYHSPFELGDLNNDGIPEMVISGSETFLNQGKTIALHANNGSVYWIANQESGGKYLCIADIEGNRYPYVFICSGDFFRGINSNGRLRKLRGTDGAVVQQTFVWRPCWGGIAVADADNDGKFELYLTDRCADYRREGQFGLGMQCYDAETFKLLWYQDAVTCSSHSMVLVDVNNDGVLDALASQQSSNNGGLYVVDGATRDKMPGYWNNRITGLGSHSNFPVYDINNDGICEFITGTDGPARMWTLGAWDSYISLGNASEPPKMANVIGDEKLEIISTSRGAKIFDGNGTLIETIANCYGMDTTLVQDVDNDWQNELIVLAGNGLLRCYDTSAYSPSPRVRTNNQFYSEQRTGAGEYVPPLGAPQPIIKSILPADEAQDVSLNPMLRVRVIDYRYDLMNITISTNASGTWNAIAVYHDVGNGWYNISTTSMNMKNKTYYWRVTAFDPYGDRLVTEKTYRFTTLASPQISNIIATPSEIPSGGSVNISCKVTDGTSVTSVKVNVTAPNGQKTNLTALGGTPSWTTLAYDDFELGWGNYSKGGSSCTLSTNGTYAHQGTHAVKIQDFLGLESSFYLTEPIDVHTPRYTSIKVDFWFIAHNMTNLTNFWVKYYDGQHWQIVDNYIKPGTLGYRPSDKPFNNDVFYHAVTWINESTYNFPANMKIRFECDAQGGTKWVFIDQVYINATTAQGTNYYLTNTYNQIGTYQYYIWAKDTMENSIRSGFNTFTVVS